MLTDKFDVAKHFLLGDVILFGFIWCERAFSAIINCFRKRKCNYYIL